MFTIYTRSNCSYCVSAKALLDRKGLQYTEIAVTADNIKEFQEKTNNAKTVPQIFYYDKLIGGYTDLVPFVEEWWDNVEQGKPIDSESSD